MSTPFLGELKLISWNFPQKGWAFCNGQFLPINQNQALFSLFGTTYGGNGQTTFALPDLRGRTPLHMGSDFIMGQVGGQAAHTLIQSEMPAHNHFVSACDLDGLKSAEGATPDNTKVLARGLVALPNQQTGPAQLYGTGAPSLTLPPATITNVGGSQPHENRQPYLVLNCIVALQGVFPSRN